MYILPDDIILNILIHTDPIDNLLLVNKRLYIFGNNEYVWFCKYKYTYPNKIRKLLLWKDSYKYESCSKFNIYDMNGLKSWEIMDLRLNMITTIDKTIKDNEYIHLGLQIKGGREEVEKYVNVEQCVTSELLIEINNKNNFLSRKQTPVVKNFKRLDIINNNVYPKLKKKKLSLELIDIARQQGLILSAKNPYKVHYLSNIVNMWNKDKTLFYISKTYRIYGSIYTIIDALRDVGVGDDEIQNVVNNLVTYYNYLYDPHKDWIKEELEKSYPNF